MKYFYHKIVYLFALIIASFSLNGQGVAINKNGLTADSSAILDLSSSDQGFLLPRLTTTRQKNIQNPATGLMIFNTDSLDLYIFTGNYWIGVINNEDTIAEWICNDSLIYENHIYPTVLIGTQCWLGANLNNGTQINSTISQIDNSITEKYCYNDDAANCLIHGGLYQWDETMNYTNTQGARGICPQGWHIPMDAEFKILDGNSDSQYGVGDPVWDLSGWRGYDAGKTLKSAYMWNDGLNGTDSLHFKALPSGYLYAAEDFSYLGGRSFFWTSTERFNIYAYLRMFESIYNTSFRGDIYKTRGHSVRCLKDG